MVCYHHPFYVKRIKEKWNTNSLLLLGLLTGSSASLLLALTLLQEGLWDEDLVLGGNGAVKVSLVCPCNHTKAHIRRV
jgi:hypothetical protein